MRGKLICRTCIGIDHGLIPACAGKTLHDAGHESDEEAHPRVCGENVKLLRLAQMSAGSSPRVRGKHSLRERQSLAGRLIPACAGKTTETSVPAYVLRAHPRVCGENFLCGGLIRKMWGSSPRVRGKR